MTLGQQMVWAAVFAANSDTSNPPPYVTDDSAEWAKWDDAIVAGAAEMASHAVDRMKEILPRVAEGHGDDSEVYTRLREMADP